MACFFLSSSFTAGFTAFLLYLLCGASCGASCCSRCNMRYGMRCSAPCRAFCGVNGLFRVQGFLNVVYPAFTRQLNADVEALNIDVSVYLW